MFSLGRDFLAIGLLSSVAHECDLGDESSDVAVVFLVDVVVALVEGGVWCCSGNRMDLVDNVVQSVVIVE